MKIQSASLIAIVLVGVKLTLTYGDEQTVEQLQNNLAQIGRQLMLQQLFVEERIRSEGDSGLKVVRLNSVGSKPCEATGLSSARKVASIHNHDNNIRTIGMGEFVAVLNGVEFRTRHNDYRLKMPSTSSTNYHETEDIPFPDVPPEVMQHTSVADQVEEMREWFKAFKDQNTTHRDYRPYFKANLCYLEGAWTTSTGALDESFESDRHFIDARNWQDLQDKIRFTSYTGKKSNDENFAYLPTTIINFINNTIPVLAQWNYRIMCHPLQDDLPTNRFRPIDDLAVRVRGKMTMNDYLNSRAARYQLNPEDSDTWSRNQPQHQLLDSLMEQIPGKNNYQAHLVDDSMGGTTYPMNGGDDAAPLNVGYYHRLYRVRKNGPMGLTTRRRGFNDQNIFMAKTNNSEVAAMSATFCRRRNCNTYQERWSYAIPLEIIYTTPLSRWNPYNLEYKGNHGTTLAKEVTANGRNGRGNANKAFDGINSKTYYMTPAEFYSGSNMNQNDPADTSTGAKYVLDPNGVLRKVCTSGTRITMQPISDVGVIRQRYPIMPTHSDGNTIYKELEALQEIVMNPSAYANVLNPEAVHDPELSLTLKMASSAPAFGSHEHIIELTRADISVLAGGATVQKLSTLEGGHQHQVTIQRRRTKNGEPFYRILRCSGALRCADGHPNRLFIQDFL